MLIETNVQCDLICLTETRIKTVYHFYSTCSQYPNKLRVSLLSPLSFPCKFSTKIFPAPNRRRYWFSCVYVKLLFSYLPLYLISLPLSHPLLLANYRIQKQYLPIFTKLSVHRTLPPHPTFHSFHHLLTSSLISDIISFHNRSSLSSLHAHYCLLTTLLFLNLVSMLHSLLN